MTEVDRRDNCENEKQYLEQCWEQSISRKIACRSVNSKYDENFWYYMQLCGMITTLHGPQMKI